MARDGDRSIAGLSEAEPSAELDADTSARHPFAITDEQRYREVNVVGAGGLGTVLLAHDERLARDVALKRMGPMVDAQQAAAQFAREARITARLDHPGIVPIHDAGVTADGRLFYTMRLIRGRSLAELAAQATDLAARVALSNAVATACHAVGYAHRRGVVHRDLKPANIMVGEFGECQVVDWGLATAIAEVPVLGPVVGTWAYVSPEAAAGRGGTVAADVWALGVLLHELIAGTTRFVGDKNTITAALASTPLPPATWPAECPPALRAIGDKAMAQQPRDRYPDAEAMALDLEAFRDGRRVAAYQYSAVELARRALWAWRWPLAVVAALLVATIAALALTAHRTERQRVRAVAAESSTQQALQRSEAALTWALAASAVQAQAGGHDARAEVLAAHALTHGESADARGVLAATLAGAHPIASAQRDIPGCRTVLPASAGSALCVAPTYLEAWQLEPLQRTWRVETGFAGALALDATTLVTWRADGVVQLRNATTGAETAAFTDLPLIKRVERNVAGTLVVAHDGQRAIVIDATTAQRVLFDAVCSTTRIDAVAVGDHGSLYAVCSDGQLRVYGPAGQLFGATPTPFGVTLQAATAMALSEGEFDLVIGSAGGDLMLQDLRGCMSAVCAAQPKFELHQRLTNQAIGLVASVGPEAIAITDGGDAVQVGRGLDAPLLRLPVADGRTALFDEAFLQTGGARWRSWRFAPHLMPRQWGTQAEVLSAAISNDGVWLATANAKRLVIRNTQHPTVETVIPVDAPVTSLAFAPDGQHLAIGLAASGDGAPSHVGVRVYAVADGSETTLRDPPRDAQFVAYLDGETILALAGTRQLIWRNAAPQASDAPAVADVAVARDGTLFTLDRSPAIWRGRADGFARVAVAAGANAIAVSGDGQHLATAAARRIAIVDRDGKAEWDFEIVDADVLDLAISGDGRWLAVATSVGRIDVWSMEHRQLVAHLRGHQQRVVWLGYRDGDLWSASQDGNVQRWRMAGLDADPAATVQTVEQQWGLTLADVAAP